MSKIYVDEIAGIASADTVVIPGHVIQVVETVWTTDTLTSTTGTWFDIGSSLAITPSSTSSKILILAEFDAYINNSGSTSDFPRVQGRFDRSGTTLRDERNMFYFDARSYGTTFGQALTRTGLKYLDSPNSASALTYKIQLRNQAVAGSSNVGNANGGSLTLMEIAG
jgi:hypothetical protein